MKRILALSSRLVVTLVMVALAAVVGLALWDYYMEAPWTRDGRVRADVVGVAPDVSGLVTQVMVQDNQFVKRGDVLFRIDPERFTLALRQAEAMVEGKHASAEQAAADYVRYTKLSDAAASQQRVEAARATDLQAKAAYDQATADRDVAKLNLVRVRGEGIGQRAHHKHGASPGQLRHHRKGRDGAGRQRHPPGRGLFEETKLPRIHVGDKATIHLMGDGGVITATWRASQAASRTGERTAGANLLANVNPTFAWVRLAQRIPVRIKLDEVPDQTRLVSGRTATVAVEANGRAPRFELLGSLG